MRRGSILASAAVVALVGMAVIFFNAGPGANAQATKREPPLETKGDASERPWKRYAGWPARDESKYNTLGNLATPPAPKQPRKITKPITGDAQKGAELAADRNRGGSCLACHVMGPAGGANLPASTRVALVTVAPGSLTVASRSQASGCCATAVNRMKPDASRNAAAKVFMSPPIV